MTYSHTRYGPVPSFSFISFYSPLHSVFSSWSHWLSSYFITYATYAPISEPFHLPVLLSEMFFKYIYIYMKVRYIFTTSFLPLFTSLLKYDLIKDDFLDYT